MILKVRQCALIILLLFLVSCSIPKTAVRTGTEDRKKSYYHYILAVEAQISQEWDTALSHLEAALREDPEYIYLKIELSQVYMRMNMVKDAIRVADEVLQMVPEHEPALSLLAKLHTSQKDFDKAIDAYQKLIKLDPKDSTSYLHLAYLYLLNDRKDEAVRTLLNVLEFDSYNEIARYYLGKIYVEKKEYEKAIVELEKAIEINPLSWSSFYLLGISYEVSGDLDKAVEKYRESIRLNAHNVDVRKRLARLFLKMSDFDSAAWPNAFKLHDKPKRV